MNTRSTVQLYPPDDHQPQSAHIPYSRSIRWRSPLEEEHRAPVVSVFISQNAYVRACAHAGSDLENEVGGWLVGKWRADKNSGEQFIVVEAVLPAPFTRQGGAFLTFTQDTQVALHEKFEERYPGKELIGWYHTHPRMGVFLSQYDTWLHSNFFPKHYQVALVIEPHSAAGGFFVRQSDGTLDPRSYFGFFELHNHNRRSVVYWRNIYPDSEFVQDEIKTL